MTGACVGYSDAVYDNQNGTVTLGTVANGGAANPMPNNPNEMTLQPLTCDAGLRSGGGATINVAWVLSAPNARLQVTTTNNANHASYQIDIYQRKQTAA
jgi:hypothetical protein